MIFNNFYIKAQNETSTSQTFTNLQIVDLLASTTCRRQLLGCCDQLAEGVSRCWNWIPFLEKNPVPDRVQLQVLVPIEGGVVLVDVDGLKDLP